jgi:sporulation protein YlmC with PRC-barrel domain
MRLSYLRDKTIKTLDGESLGRVHEVHCESGVVTALMCGPGSFLERLTAKKEGRRIPWACVRKITDSEVLVTPDPPQRGTKSAPRNPRRTPQPTARRSKR